MEKNKVYQIRLEILEKAVESFREVLALPLEEETPVKKDAIQNGQVRKCKCCAELLWKMIKHNLFIFEGIDERSPKGAIKAFYRVKTVPDDLYNTFFDMLEDLLDSALEDHFGKNYSKKKTAIEIVNRGGGMLGVEAKDMRPLLSYALYRQREQSHAFKRSSHFHLKKKL